MSRLLAIVLVASCLLTMHIEARAQDAAAATDPSSPLTQLQFQNVFIPESYDASGYSNQFIIQPVIPLTIGENSYFKYHILRPTIPIIAPTPDPDGPAGVEGGLGDTTLLDVFVHPVEELKTNWGIGYSAILPTSTDSSLGAGEWQLGPAVFATTTAVDKWLLGALYFQPFSLESDAHQLRFQVIATHFLPDEWYIGWGDEIWKLDDENGGYNMPLNLRFGKVADVGKHKMNLFVQPSYTPDGLRSGPGGDKWSFKLNVTFLLPDAKFDAPLLSRLCGDSCR